MNRFQIAEIAGEQSHAGTKATEDVIAIAKRLDFEPVYIHMNDLQPGAIHKVKRQARFYVDWKHAYKLIENNSVVLLQHPFHYPQLERERILLKLKRKKNVRFISIVHDVEELRTLGKKKYHMHEFEFMTKIADVLIIHNDVMRDFFIKKGFDDRKMVTLGIFDYLMKENNDILPTYEKSINIAGNLDIKKSGYLSCLSEVNCRFHLYGPNYSLGDAPSITYGGVLLADQIPKVLTKGFGLIWDGDSIDTCKGGYGDYLRYNNPHKLSLYLSSGLPVIIWKYAAEAAFVEKNEVGYAVESLREIPKLMESVSENDYRRLAENVRKISERLVAGSYMQKALDDAMNIIEL